MLHLRPQQREGVDFLLKHKLRVIIADGPGTGKTATTLTALFEEYPRTYPALVACPASVTRNWAREARMWCPDILTYVIEDTTTPIPVFDEPALYVISWALVDLRSLELHALRLASLVADEFHYLKNPDAIRSQAFTQLAQNVRHILLLSGTPIVNRKDDMDVAYTLLGTTNPPMLRRLLEDVAPDIPEKKRSVIPLQLRPHHRAAYDKANKEFEDWLRKAKEELLGEGMAEDEVARAIANEGFVKIGYLRRLVGEYKVPAAADWISRAVRLGEPVVVFLEHQQTLKLLTKALRRQRVRFCVLEGSTSPKQRQQIVADFQAYKYPVFIGTRAAKEGITLTAARHLLFVERFFTSADEEQAEDRIRRIGQRKKTTMWYLHAVDTVDGRMDEIVRNKRELVKAEIGAAVVPETDQDNVQTLLEQWASYTDPHAETASQLGLGEPLTALPSPNATHAISFRSSRWSLGSAKRWAAMNGYTVVKAVEKEDRFNLITHHQLAFRAGTFKAVHVADDVHVIVGERRQR